MPRQNNRRGGRRGRGGSRHVIPFITIAYIDEGKTADIKLADLMPGNRPTSAFGASPWRLIKARVECCILEEDTTPNPRAKNVALVQVSLNDAKTTNVESVVSLRWLVYTLPRTRTIRMRSPNLWKEDEEANQAIISIMNTTISNKNTRVIAYVTAWIEFGPMRFANPQGVPIVNCTSDDSLCSSFNSFLNMGFEEGDAVMSIRR